MTKNKTYLHERFASNDADENDRYLSKLRELADNHPELRSEYETFRIYQAGFTNGVLNQVEAFYDMIGKVKTYDEEKDGPFHRPEFENVDGISFGNQTKFNGMSKQEFVDWVNTMAVNGDCPMGQWIENEWRGLTFVFDKSLFTQANIKGKSKMSKKNMKMNKKKMSKLANPLDKSLIKEILHEFDDITHMNFSDLNNKFRHTQLGESKRLIKAYDVFAKHWMAFRKKIETEPTSD